MKTIIVGLGNPILGDDGVGWKVAEGVKKAINSSLMPALEGEREAVEVVCLSLGGISLMEHLIGYERAILIDAFNLGEPLGSVLILKMGELPNYSALHVTSAHDMSLHYAMELGKGMGAQLPEDVTIVGIGTARIYDFSEELSASVASAVPQAVNIVLNLLHENVTI